MCVMFLASKKARVHFSWTHKGERQLGADTGWLRVVATDARRRFVFPSQPGTSEPGQAGQASHQLFLTRARFKRRKTT